MLRVIRVLEEDKNKKVFIFEDGERVSISFNYDTTIGEWSFANPAYYERPLMTGVFRCDDDKFIFACDPDTLPKQVFISFLMYFKSVADKHKNYLEPIPFDKQ